MASGSSPNHWMNILIAVLVTIVGFGSYLVEHQPYRLAIGIGGVLILAGTLLTMLRRPRARG